ncbi:MAG TPA: hypothetical protein VGC41_24825, partial [Kofleriaceae bacterium]
WFAGKSVVFDYPAKRMTLGSLPAVSAEHRIPVHFAPDMAYGRISMTVAGEIVPMLLDTGATVILTDSALAALHGDRTRATSFIIHDVLERWHAAHPEWRVIEDADQIGKGSRMIEVPAVTIGGYTVGPVWFTERPDQAFHTWMAQWMDQPTDGALGGDAFRTLRVGVDWTAGTATFERQ